MRPNTGSAAELTDLLDWLLWSWLLFMYQYLVLVAAGGTWATDHQSLDTWYSVIFIMW